ncbi:hypothetical protein N0V83_010757 [Neocucurbitaria cava]|uniref:F-box domain-containing protein n=1 Tax=Neocucurbitaria cava TaxID=798079 RepID=A0A9W9CH56_9PLEO|nr:hypothetical protein N0V83_010757 [Neocucurbitaria cava]
MHHRSSILSYRPKTSSAALDDDTAAAQNSIEHAMKRTASQTFNTQYHDMRETAMALDAVNEASLGADGIVSHHAHASSLSRAFGAVTGSFTRQKARRRLSSFSSAPSAPRRRGSIQSFIESLPSSSTGRKTSTENSRQPLQHQDSGIPTFQQATSMGAKSFSFKRLGSMRRRPTTSAFSEDVSKSTVAPSSIYPSPVLPGAAARQAAAAANQDRQNQLRREQEHTHRFLNGLIPTLRDPDIKDNESGVDMTCASPIVRTDSVTEKKMIDPFQRLPAELITTVLSNLDAASLVRAERVSRSWHEHAASPHVWRNVFLRKHEPEVHVSPTPIQMGGVGIGKMFDENKAITGSRDRTIRVWDLKTNKCIKVYVTPSVNGTRAGNDIYHVPADYHDASILCLQYDDEIMVTGSSDYTCIVWDITGDEFVPMYRLRGHEAGVLDVCLDDKYIISCSKDAMIKVWDRKTGTCMRTLKGHRGPVNAVQLRGNFLVSASGDGVAKLWNLETGVSIKDFPSEDRGLAAVEFSDDAKYVLAGGNDHVVYKFDASTGELVHSRVKHDGLVRSLFLDAFNGRIVSGSYDQSIQVSDYETGKTYAVYKNWTTSWILSAKSDYRRVVATSQDGRTLILDFGHNVPGSELLVGSK